MGYSEHDGCELESEDLGTPILRICLASDWHIGAATDKQIKRTLSYMKKENFDIIVFAGDYNGGFLGKKAVRSILNLTRKEFPDIPILSVLGNHDFWVKGKRSPNEFLSLYNRPNQRIWELNYEKIKEHFKTFNVHFLDEDGVWRDPRWPGIAIFGHTLWYHNPNPRTNDCKYMPHIHDINGFMYKRGMSAVEGQLNNLNRNDYTRIFVSHMPVFYPKGIKHGDVMYGGPPQLGNNLWDYHDVRYFLNGHCHQTWKCFPRYEAGSDYGMPRFIVVNVYSDMRQMVEAPVSPRGLIE